MWQPCELLYTCYLLACYLPQSGAGVGKKRVSSATRRPYSASRPETGRSGIIAARHQRVLSARKARQQDASADDEPRRPSTAAPPRRPLTAASRPRTAAARPASATVTASVTVETERGVALRALRSHVSATEAFRCVDPPAGVLRTVRGATGPAWIRLHRSRAR